MPPSPPCAARTRPGPGLRTLGTCKARTGDSERFGGGGGIPGPDAAESAREDGLYGDFSGSVDPWHPRKPGPKRLTAHKAAVKLRQEKTDRLVLACASCPTTKPSKRRPLRWATIARALAARFDLQAGEVREALTAEIAAERGRMGTP